MTQETRNPALGHLELLVGEWESESTHPAFPGTVVPGRAAFEWLEGRQYLVWRERRDHPDFPDSISLVGCGAPVGADASTDWPGGCLVHYYDSRGVFRATEWAAEAGTLRLRRDHPGFSMRCVYTLGADGDAMTLISELSQDGATWERDLQATYRRVARG